MLEVIATPSGRAPVALRRNENGAQTNSQSDFDQMKALLLDKEKAIGEYKETVEILELKIAKLEQLVRLKDARITKLKDALCNQPPFE